MRYRIKATSESPLCISRRHITSGMPIETLPYIPGSALRGAAAQTWIQEYGAQSADDEAFKILFTLPGVSWGNLYPSRDGNISSPIPSSALTCKWNAGFRSDEQVEAAGDGVWDILLDQAVRTFKKGEATGVEKCDLCGAPLENYNGYYGVVGDGEKRFSFAGCRTRLLAHTALMEQTETAKAGLLYTQEALEEEQVFTGCLEVGEKNGATEKLVKLLEPGNELRVGSGKTSGLGLLKISEFMPDGGEFLRLPALNNRLQDFNEAALERDLTEGRFWFSLNLYSDAVIMDPYGRFSSVINREILNLETSFWEVAPEFPTSLRYELSFTSTRIVSGWNMAKEWQLPKYDVVAVVKGSVFLFSTAVDDRTLTETWLARLEKEGLGQRGPEGFGRLIVSSPFHVSNGGAY